MKKFCLLFILWGFGGAMSLAECPLDHFVIGVNEDGVAGTDDDTRLFVNCEQKYRHCDTWYYSLSSSIYPTYRYRIGEPGFDIYQDTNANAVYTYDPNHAPGGVPETDFRIEVRILSLSPGLRLQHKDYPNFTLSAEGESFNYSEIWQLRGDGHMHLSYQADSQQALRWITFGLFDELGRYQPSEPFTLVFNDEPRAGDLVVDGLVDLSDLARLQVYWLNSGGSKANDYYERADANRDGRVDLGDFALLMTNWLEGVISE